MLLFVATPAADCAEPRKDPVKYNQPMSASPGKAPDARAMLMRLSIPAGGGLLTVAAQVARKIGEYLGTDVPDAESVGVTLDGLATRVCTTDSADITFEFREVDGALVILASCNGRSSEVRYPLPA